MSEIVQEVTAEEVARHYAACMDSVNLINAGQPEGMEDAEWEATVARNKEHLVIQLAKADMYAGFDLTPLENAIK